MSDPHIKARQYVEDIRKERGEVSLDTGQFLRLLAYIDYLRGKS